jgi:FtsP/CotA-like multicopper oxidase with cupredoxin domain
MLTRRQLLARGAAGGAGVMFAPALLRTAAAAAPPKAYLADLAQYMPPVVVPDSNGQVALAVQRLKKTVHPAFARGTDVWSYELPGIEKSSWLGPLIAVDSSQATTVSYRYGIEGGHLFANSIDKTVLDPWIHDADASELRFMSHLHGSFVDGDNDGNPFATPHTEEWEQEEEEIKQYPPQDRACLIWYHQHAHGLTHLNVYAGLAGGYLVRDADDTGRLDNQLGLPADFDAAGDFIGWYEVPLVLQDRTFTASGQLSYPAGGWIPEFFGNAICVNGAIEPFLNVEPRLYRFRIINGCNARFINFDLRPSSLTGVRPPMWVIGSDGGFIATPTQLNTLVMGPGERYDVVVDFSGVPSERVNLNNSILPKQVVNPGLPEPVIMQFRVGALDTVKQANLPPVDFSTGRTLTSDTPGNRLGATTGTRVITLEEVMGAKGPLAVILNGRSFEGRPVKNPVPATGYPFDLDPQKAVGSQDDVANGATEEWSFVNTTVDSHPMHVHFVQFGVQQRVPFDAARYSAALAAARASDPDARLDFTPFLTGPPIPIPAHESGWKDTVQAHPGQVTTIKAKFDLRGFATPQDFVYHCHILEHETNSMMRPYRIM